MSRQHGSWIRAFSTIRASGTSLVKMGGPPQHAASSPYTRLSIQRGVRAAGRVAHQAAGIAVDSHSEAGVVNLAGRDGEVARAVVRAGQVEGHRPRAARCLRVVPVRGLVGGADGEGEGAGNLCVVVVAKILELADRLWIIV